MLQVVELPPPSAFRPHASRLKSSRPHAYLSNRSLEQLVPALAVLALVQPYRLALRVHAKPDRPLENDAKQQGYQHGVRERHDHIDKLDQHLLRIAMQKPCGRIACEYTGSDCTPHAPDAVDSEHVERVVVAELGLKGDRGVADARHHGANHQRG